MRTSNSSLNSLAAVLSSVAIACASQPAPPPALLEIGSALPRTCEKAIQFYTTRERAPSEYKELALLEASGDNAGVLSKLRSQASQVGATGVILGATGSQVTGATVRPPLPIVGTRVEVNTATSTSAVAIAVQSDSTRVRQTCTHRMTGDRPNGAVSLSSSEVSLLREQVGKPALLRGGKLEEPWLTKASITRVSEDVFLLSTSDAETLEVPLAMVQSVFRERNINREYVVVLLKSD